MLARVHELRTFPGCQVLRDDELGGVLGGSKWRKYATLLPALEGLPEVLLRGGPTSHNVLALALQLRERGIRPLFPWLQRGRPPGGVFRLTRQVLGEGLIPCDDVEAVIARYPGVRVVAEGASDPEALPGALTLAAQVREGPWRRVFVDSGTGMLAAALVLGLDGSPLEVDVVDLTGGFPAALEHWRQHLPVQGCIHRIHRPPVGASFGSQPAAVHREIERLAREEGFLTDPVYSGKLFLTARTLATPGSLLIHSGGVLSLAYSPCE